ncbi:MAG: AAA family ATPase [Shewanella xiamenensis]|nr:AAA family ATPase [Shewanella xiamenensis]
MTKIKAKLALLLEQLNHGLVDREATMKSALLSILAGENILLIGPPGTAKSLVARRISKIFNENNLADSTYFEYLLTKFSTPEEIFGPLSIKALKDDRFKRNTDGYLPSVKIAFLDEVFKASSSILNALLTIMNERIYHNGTKAEDVPLRALIAASNELPTGQEELSALYDRFLVRSFVDYISANKLLHLFDLSEEVEIQDPLTQDD